MAIGDKAFAKGLVVYPSTQDKRKGFENDNQRGDELADEMTARAAADAALSAAAALKLDKTSILYSAAAPANIAGTGFSGRIWLKPV